MYNRYKFVFVTVSLLKRFRNGRFTSETAAAVSEAKRSPGSRNGLKHPLGLLEISIHNIFQGGDDGRGYT
jgi:hypothetical protein